MKNGELKVNRNKADGWSKGISHSILFLKEKDVLDVHILSDQSSLELFTDNVLTKQGRLMGNAYIPLDRETIYNIYKSLY